MPKLLLKILIFFIFSALTITVAAQPQDLYFQHQNFGLEDNLGRTQFSTFANCVQDSLGFFWLSGDLGLYRFDSNKFEFTHKNDLNLSGRGNFRHEVDARGNNWIYEEGLVQVDSIVPIMIDLLTKRIRLAHFFVVNTSPRQEIDYFNGVSGRNGHLFVWDNDNNVYEIAGDSLHFKGAVPKDDFIRSIDWVVKEEQIIVTTEKGTFYKRSESKGEFLQIKLPKFAHGVVIGASGFMFVADSTNGDHSRHAAYYFDLIDDKLYDLPFSAKKGKLWILGGNNIDEWVIRKDGEVHFLKDYGEGNIGTNAVWSAQELFVHGQDPTSMSMLNNQYWFYFGAFVELIELKRKQFSTHLIEEKQLSVRSILNVGDSSLLFNTYGGDRTLDISLSESSSSFRVPGLAQGGYGFAQGKDGSLYSGLHARGIRRFDPSGLRSEFIPFTKEDKVYESGALIPFIDSTGKVWVGLENGLGYVDTLDDKIHYVEDLTILKNARLNGVSAAFNSGYFWLATSVGAFLFDPYLERIIEDIPKLRNREVVSVRQFNQDSVWMLPIEGAVYLWQKRTDTWDSLSIFKSEWQNNLHDVLPDERGFLWFPSNNGLIRYDPFKKDFIRLTMETDGLPFNEFNKLASLALPDGRFLFGGMGGVICIDPQQFSLSQYNNTKTAYRVRVVKATVTSSEEETTVPVPIDADEVVDVVSSTEQIAITFAYLDPMRPSCKYYYRLQEGSWFELDKPQLVINELGYSLREIEFKVVALGTGRLLGRTKLKLRKKRPWYLGRATIVGYGILLLLMINRLVNWRIRLIAREKAHLERIVVQRTQELKDDRAVIKQQRDDLEQFTKTQQRLFSIVGHELRSGLLVTINLRRVVSYLLEKRRFDDLDKVASQLRRQATETNLALDQLLQWGKMAIYDTPPCISSFFLKAVLADVLVGLQENIDAKDLTINCTVPGQLEVEFDREAMNILVRNLVHNAIKFSPLGGKIDIRYVDQKISHAIIVTDEGPGIEVAEFRSWSSGRGLLVKTGSEGEKGTGLGLMICKKLAEKNKGGIDLEERSGNEQGAVVRLWWQK
jgi:signal transduction histidine kinase